ncbi:MAG: histidine-type phosphatase [Prevotella sp.]|nr:histidine-type phosphatase [Prevotella sp.]
MIPVEAQTSKSELLSHLELASGNYCNYPNPTGHVTPAPAGYEPFYVSHYGRHGSRYMTDDDAYKYVLGKMDTAQVRGWLTEKGVEVYERLKVAAADAYHRDGDLTQLGGRQHRAIAHRLCVNYPSLMMQPITVKANSSTVRRCMLSMANFCQELLIMNPSLNITMDASEHDMYYIIPNDSIEIPKSETDGDLYDKLDKFRHEKLNGRHQIELLFNDTKAASEFIDGYQFADALWNITSDMLCLPELGLSFNDLFTEDELIDGFRVYNASWCLWEGLMPGSRHNYYAIYPLLKNFLDEADLMIASGKKGVRLRFGHDSVVLPFSFILGVQEAMGGTDDMEDLHNHFSIFRLIPMAGNVQLVFFRKQGSDDILVKFLMNENETSVPITTDCYPFYHWKDVRTYYRNMLEEANITYKTKIEKDEDDDD